MNVQDSGIRVWLHVYNAGMVNVFYRRILTITLDPDYLFLSNFLQFRADGIVHASSAGVSGHKFHTLESEIICASP